MINIGAYGSGRYAISPETKFIVDGQEWVFMNGLENTSDGYMYAYYCSPEFEFSSGAPVETKSIVEENGMYYCLDEEGNRLYGFQTVDGENYYFGTEYDPTMKFGNQYIDGREYYFGEDGKTPKNQFVSPWYNTYYYDETGWPHIGWLELDGEKYYADENGIILKGVNTIDGKTYLFDRNDGGKMVRNKMAHDYYGDHYYDDDGVMQTGFVTYEGNTWYFYENGEMARNWQTIDGNTYFFGDNDGIMATGTTFIYWRYYEFDENGVLQGDI
ncbi:N-acetylmuramoyl-L-alanine amidase family protein [Butyrivibrio sp. MC2021]|uniref:N-acetylmuramoyl-L-alanine amidase family protein n=1 Tax=Butyrivibrio sp. MC2021 TaxID=1408306 RepID=UPI0018CC5B5B|nr:hypothetical protein [Butyrivibrio sp. MC2021]